MRPPSLFTIVVVLVIANAAPVRAADNALTPEEKAAGWRLLFDGKQVFDKETSAGWKLDNGRDVLSPIEDGCLVPTNAAGLDAKGKPNPGGYLTVFRDGKGNDQFGDFILKCDVKMDKRCNSGIFFRTGNPMSPVQTGFEMQVASGTGTGKHDFGAIYDAAAITKNVAHQAGDADPWNHVVLTAKGPIITVEVNGEQVLKMNLDEYTTAGKNPDGTKNKYKTPLKDFPRKGYIGFQDHRDGTKSWYKNIKILELK